MNVYLRLFFSPAGVINRRTYRFAALFIPLLNCMLLWGLISLYVRWWPRLATKALLPWPWLFCFLTLWPSICVTAKRLRAVGASPWWQAAPRLCVSLGIVGLIAAPGRTLDSPAEILLVTVSGLLSLLGWLGDCGLLVWLGIFSPPRLDVPPEQAPG